MDRELFEAFSAKAPAAVAVHMILDRILDPIALDTLFEDNAQKQYTQKLLFSRLVEMTADLVLGEEPSVHAAYRRHAATLGVSAKSVYNKLAAMEPGICARLVAHSAEAAGGILEALRPTAPDLLPGWRMRILDGNHMSATEHRIGELRTIWDAPLPGFVLAVMDQKTGLVTDAFVEHDGHAQERSLLGDVLGAVRKGDVWVADRNFCTNGFLHGIHSRRAAFVVRRHGSLDGHNPGPWEVVGTTAEATVWERTLELRFGGAVLTVRHVRVERFEPTRDGETTVEILTNLPASVGALEVSEVYRGRWTIEGLFHAMAQTLQCEPTALGHPGAFLFVFCMGLVASNAVRAFKGGLERVHGAGTWRSLSLYYLMLEVRKYAAGLELLMEGGIWSALRNAGEGDWLVVLLTVLGKLDPAKYRKSTRGAKKIPPKRTAYNNGGHASTHKLLEGRRAAGS